MGHQRSRASRARHVAIGDAAAHPTTAHDPRQAASPGATKENQSEIEIATEDADHSHADGAAVSSNHQQREHVAAPPMLGQELSDVGDVLPSTLPATCDTEQDDDGDADSTLQLSPATVDAFVLDPAQEIQLLKARKEALDAQAKAYAQERAATQARIELLPLEIAFMRERKETTVKHIELMRLRQATIMQSERPEVATQTEAEPMALERVIQVNVLADEAQPTNAQEEAVDRVATSSLAIEEKRDLATAAPATAVLHEREATQVDVEGPKKTHDDHEAMPNAVDDLNVSTATMSPDTRRRWHEALLEALAEDASSQQMASGWATAIAIKETVMQAQEVAQQEEALAAQEDPFAWHVAIALEEEKVLALATPAAPVASGLGKRPAMPSAPMSGKKPKRDGSTQSA